MQNFFDPNEHAEIIIPMYGTIHFITLAIMLAFIPVLIWKKESIKRLSHNRSFMVRFMILFLASEILYWILMWRFEYEPFSDRFPLNLCGSLSLIIPTLVLAKKYETLRFFTFWALGAGLISLINPSFIHDEPWSFGFINYLTRHYFLFLFPIFLIIGRGFYVSYKLFLQSMFTLMGYAFFIFLLNWALGTNYLHLGRYNPLPIPFLPYNLSEWPWTYPSFLVTGVILLHLLFLTYRMAGIKKTEEKRV